MSDDTRKPFFKTLPGLLTGIAAVITAVSGLYVAVRSPAVPPGPGPEPARCVIAGLVFDVESGTSVPGVWVDLYRDLRKLQQRPEQLKAGVATTGPDGTFSANCDWVKEQHFPLVLALRHEAWQSTMITGPSIEGRGQWDGIKIPLRMSAVTLKPLRELRVSHTSKKVGADWFVIGNVENRSDRSFPCVKLRFKMSTTQKDQLKGEPARDLGFLEIELRNIAARETRPYQKQRPSNVSYYLASTEECPS